MNTSRTPRPLMVAVGVTVTALGLAACTSDPSPAASAPIAPLPTPMATSVQTAAGTWASVPMGNLDDPLNTFWQLFLQPAGQDSWSNKVEATATATNGGLVLASRDGQQLVVGIRPSNHLHYTPIIATSNGGTTWDNGLLDARLASSPDALAVSRAGSALALETTDADVSEVVSGSGLSSWQPVVTKNALDSSPAGRRCRPTELTAAGFIGSRPLVGAACRKPGATAIFAQKGSAWQLVGPRLPRSASRDRFEVLALMPSSSGVTALLGASGTAGTGVTGAWTSDGTGWQASTPLRVPDGEELVSYGPTNLGGVFALFATGSGSRYLYTLDASGEGWQLEPTPPPGTRTVAYEAGGTVDALAVGNNVLTVWRLEPARGWRRTQTIWVPIQYGSSS